MNSDEITNYNDERLDIGNIVHITIEGAIDDGTLNKWIIEDLLSSSREGTIKVTITHVGTEPLAPLRGILREFGIADSDDISAVIEEMRDAGFLKEGNGGTD